MLSNKRTSTREDAVGVRVPEAMPLDEYHNHVGMLLGVSDWIVIGQGMIDQFSGVPRDLQFIHIDPIRAKETPFGGTIAHGLLTLSLVSAMSFTAVPAIAGAQVGINYGFNSIRFISPVRAGSRVRGSFTLKKFVERQPRQWQSTLDVRVDIENVSRPALIAEWLTLTTF